MTANWIARFSDPEDRSREDVQRIINDLLTQAGFKVLNVIELNPQPLRVRQATP